MSIEVTELAVDDCDRKDRPGETQSLWPHVDSPEKRQQRRSYSKAGGGEHTSCSQRSRQGQVAQGGSDPACVVADWQRHGVVTLVCASRPPLPQRARAPCQAKESCTHRNACLPDAIKEQS